MSRRPQHEELQELAALYALGGLDDGERRTFEAHLNEGCAECAHDVRSFSDAASLVAENTAAAPPPALRSRVLAIPSPEPPPPLPPVPDGFLVVRGGEGEWKPTGVAGVLMKPLYYDRERDQFATLLKVDPGARYPAHRHGIPEHCMVLAGDIRFGNVVLVAGDYVVGKPGSEHTELWSQTGALAMIVGSPHDELLA
jgi:anti-sigma factor ChrR (cupin superfamily)